MKYLGLDSPLAVPLFALGIFLGDATRHMDEKAPAAPPSTLLEFHRVEPDGSRSDFTWDPRTGAATCEITVPGPTSTQRTGFYGYSRVEPRPDEWTVLHHTWRLAWQRTEP